MASISVGHCASDIVVNGGSIDERECNQRRSCVTKSSDSVLIPTPFLISVTMNMTMDKKLQYGGLMCTTAKVLDGSWKTRVIGVTSTSPIAVYKCIYYYHVQSMGSWVIAEYCAVYTL